MPNLDAATVVIQIRSFPRLLVFLVESMDDVDERRRLVDLGLWEWRIGTGAWKPVAVGRQN
jgi:hypothetical protein